MAPRRAHTKSRNGCDQCKKRRVKCDEGGPPCANCLQREMECVYSGPALLRRGSLSATTTTSTSTSTNTASPSFPAATTPKTVAVSPAVSTTPVIINPPRPPEAHVQHPATLSRRLRELELMHHWCTATCFGLAAPLSEQLRNYAPKEALKHPYLMDAMLALAAFHLANELNDPVAGAPYVALGLQYQNDSVRPFREALQNIGPTNCNAVFICSILMMISALVAPLLSSGTGAHQHSIVDSMLLLVDFGLGVGSIIEMSESWLVRGPFANIWVVEPEPQSSSDADDDADPAIRRLRNLNDLFNGKPGDPPL